MALCNYLFKIYQGFWLNYFDYLFFLFIAKWTLWLKKDEITVIWWNEALNLLIFTCISPLTKYYIRSTLFVGLYVCADLCPVCNFFLLWHRLPCLAHWCITMRWWVVYIHEFSMTLIFDLKVKFKRVFDMTLCPGHSFFVPWHSHTWSPLPIPRQ